MKPFTEEEKATIWEESDRVRKQLLPSASNERGG
jgi:hypothetical protein